jgi:hypothetical protein
VPARVKQRAINEVAVFVKPALRPAIAVAVQGGPAVRTEISPADIVVVRVVGDRGPDHPLRVEKRPAARAEESLFYQVAVLIVPARPAREAVLAEHGFAVAGKVSQRDAVAGGVVVGLETGVLLVLIGKGPVSGIEKGPPTTRRRASNSWRRPNTASSLGWGLPLRS